MKQSKVFNATLIGIFAGVFCFGLVSWLLSSEKHVGFFIPMLIPAYMIYKLLKKPNPYSDLEKVLQERHLD